MIPKIETFDLLRKPQQLFKRPRVALTYLHLIGEYGYCKL